MTPVISVENLSKTFLRLRSGQATSARSGPAGFDRFNPTPSHAIWKPGGQKITSMPRIARIARRVKHQPRIYPEGYDVTNWANEKNNSRNLSNLWQKRIRKIRIIRGNRLQNQFVEFEQFVASSLKKNSWQTIFSLEFENT